MWFSLKRTHAVDRSHNSRQENPGEPRDLRFRGPFVEMFFGGAGLTPGSLTEGCRVLYKSAGIAARAPWRTFFRSIREPPVLAPLFLAKTAILSPRLSGSFNRSTR